MDNIFNDGLKDYITQSNFKLESNSNLSPARYRAKMKSGVSTLLTTGFTGIIWGIDRGLGNGVERNSTNGLPCGEYVTIYFYPSSNSFRNNHFVVAGNISNFLSQFEIVYDCFPEYVEYRGNIIINSEDFISKKGIFDNADTAVEFRNSTFKIAPKIYSDAAMKEFQHFPLAMSLPRYNWQPFIECPNLEKIENQGTFGERLEALFPCNLAYYDDDGFANLSAYPSGGAPKFIQEFVQAEKIHFSERMPIFDTSRLKYAVNPFKIEKIVIDAQGAPQLPFGGLDYSGLDMEKLWLYDSKITVNLPYQEPLSFAFSWGTLGIVAPDSCKDVKNLHRIWQLSYGDRQICDIATPEILKTKVHFGWGNSLETFLEGEPDLTEDLMSLVPENIQRIQGFYQKDVLGEDTFGPSRFGSYRSRMMLNNSPHAYAVQRLPETCETVCGYAVNLYAHQEIETDIFIPALPSNVIYIRDCYRRTFYNATGTPQALPSSDVEPAILIAWNQSGNSYKPINLIINADSTFTSELGDHWAEADSSLIYRRDAFTGNATATESWGNYSEMLTDLKTSGQASAELRIISSEIVLEANSFNNLQFSGSFQQDCYFGAGIDPRVVDGILPLNLSKEWNSYRRSLLISTGVAWGNPQYFWTGELQVDGGWINDSYRVNFIVLISYVDFEEEDFEPYKISIDEIIMNGSPRTEGTNVVTPYRGFLSPDLIKGDYVSFQNSKNIVLNDPTSFITYGGEAVGTYASFTGGALGWNAIRINEPLNASGERQYYIFVGSYNPFEGRFGGNDLKPSDEQQFYFQNPFWIDSYPMRTRTIGAEAVINNQADLNVIMNQFNTSQ